MNLETILVLILGIIIGIWNTYLYLKIREIEYGMPSIEDIAKEVIKVKIPLSELPQDLQEQYMRGMSPIPNSIQPKNPLVG